MIKKYHSITEKWLKNKIFNLNISASAVHDIKKRAKYQDSQITVGYSTISVPWLYTVGLYLRNIVYSSVLNPIKLWHK